MFVSWASYLKDPFVPNHELIPIIHQLLRYFEDDYFGKINVESILYNPAVALNVPYQDLVIPEFVDRFSSCPELMIACLNVAASQAIHHMRVQQNIVPPEQDLPVSVHITRYPVRTWLKDLKSNLVSKFISIQGNVIRVSSMKPLLRQMYKYPDLCGTPSCKGKVFVPDRLNENNQTIDWQKITVQEKLTDDQVDAGRIPRTIDCELTMHLVDKLVPGDVVSVSGIVKMLPSEETQKVGMTQMFNLYIDANCIAKVHGGDLSEVEQLGNSKDAEEFDENELHVITDIKSSYNLFSLLVNSFCPLIFGNELVKAGLLLALFGGTRRDGRSNHMRPDIHVLIVGDPGLGKSQMLLSALKLAPRGVYVCGNTTSASGLTVTISKDPQTGATTLEGGALVLGDQGVCCIDEFDKMNDHHALLEAMEQQSISIAKAGIVCTLPARTTVLAAANPVQGHYNKCKSVSENLKMKGALLSRFDLVFILIDKADAHMDKVLSEHIMKIHAKSGRTDISRIAQAMDNDSILSDDLITRLRHFAGKADPIPSRIMRKYIAYCRLNCHPKLSKDAADLLNKFYLKLRSDFRSRDSTPVTTRQLEAMIRLSEARAKCEMRNVVTLDDARDAIEIIKFSLSDVETAASTVKGKRGQVKTFLQEIQHMARETGNSSFTMDGFAKIAQTKNLQFSSIRDVVENLNVQGYLLKRANGIYDLAI